ncbi:MAG TPA: hypothetical protein VM165_22095 [Planctomycetaceae bacterium]|nr:hypothetical protein [Planctomycetaceae bacterium]
MSTAVAQTKPAAQTKQAAPAKPPAPAKPAAQAKPAPPAQTAAQGPPATPLAGQPLGPPITPKPGGPLTPNDATYHVDAIEFQLGPGEFVEYKFRLNTGAMMMFNWKSTGPMEVDFHTVPDGKPISASETYLRGIFSKGQGTYRAPYPGMHGWYWNNAGKETIKLVLNASGFWTEARMYSGDPTGDVMPLQDPEPPPQ